MQPLFLQVFLSALLLTEKASPSNELSLKVPCRPSSTIFCGRFYLMTFAALLQSTSYQSIKLSICK